MYGKMEHCTVHFTIISTRNEELVKKWLDPEFDAVEEFAPILEPQVRKPMKVTRIGKPSKWDPQEDAFLIKS